MTSNAEGAAEAQIDASGAPVPTESGRPAVRIQDSYQEKPRTDQDDVLRRRNHGIFHRVISRESIDENDVGATTRLSET